MEPGVIKKLTREERSYYDHFDIENLLGVSKTKAYELINSTRDECVQQGILSKDYPKGKIPKKFFNPLFALD